LNAPVTITASTVISVPTQSDTVIRAMAWMRR
jgi:hypothetical protein